MNKKKLVFTILFVISILILGITGCGSNDEEEEVAIPITDISIQDLDETFTLYYVEELQILGKYMFVTYDEYYDSESGYSDDTYYVYTGDQPMDNNELHEEYYVAMFYDESGELQLASLSNRDWDFSEQVASASPANPVTVSAYVKAAANYEHQVLISEDKEINATRERAMNDVASTFGIPYNNIDMVYKHQ